MKLLSIRAVTVLCLVAGVLSWRAMAAERIEFSFVPDKTEVKKSEAMIFTLKLENTGETPVLVNTRFFVNDPAAQPLAREVTLSVMSPQGAEMKFRSKYETGLPKTDYFVKLEPGKSASLEYKKDLKGYFDITELGEYKVIATYENSCGAEIGADAVKGAIVSSEVKIKVIE